MSALLIGMAFRRQSAVPLSAPDGDRGAAAGTGGERIPGELLGSPGGGGRVPAADIPDVAPAGSGPGTLSTVTVQSGGSEAFGLAGNVPAGSEPGSVRADDPGSVGAPAEAGRRGGTAAGRRDVGGAPAEVAPASGREFGYTVQPGDSPWRISERFYGSGGQWKRILDANPGVSSERLQVGTKLVIPGRAGPDRAAAVAAPAGGSGPDAPPAPAGASRVHRVAPGDSLYSLAEKYLGAGTRYAEIGALNPGIDPNSLKVGQEIRIPAR